ncbi:hypothetical protein CR105_25545, partial [Massilia eurypsychrophila]
DWRAIVKKAWSLKFNAAALVLGALEVYVGMVKPDGIPTGAFAMLSGLATTAAMVARVMAQKELSDGPTK